MTLLDFETLIADPHIPVTPDYMRERTDVQGEHWVWTGNIHPLGGPRGRCRRGCFYPGPELYWALNPETRYVSRPRRRCDEPRCIRPDHWGFSENPRRARARRAGYRERAARQTIVPDPPRATPKPAEPQPRIPTHLLARAIPAPEELLDAEQMARLNAIRAERQAAMPTTTPKYPHLYDPEDAAKYHPLYHAEQVVSMSDLDDVRRQVSRRMEQESKGGPR